MDYRIMERGPFTVIGKGIRVTTRDKQNLKLIPQFWCECCQNGITQMLMDIAEEGDLLGICMDFDPEGEEFTYMIAVEKGMGVVPEGLVKRDIPAYTWAVFESIGPVPEAIQKVWERIFTEWFAASGYKHAGGPEIEVYPDGDTNSQDYRCEVWIPVEKA